MELRRETAHSFLIVKAPRYSKVLVEFVSRENVKLFLALENCFCRKKKKKKPYDLNHIPPAKKLLTPILSALWLCSELTTSLVSSTVVPQQGALL